MAREAATLTTTDFDTKHFEIRKLELKEAIGRPFEVTIDAVVTGPEGLPLDKVAGAEITGSHDVQDAYAGVIEYGAHTKTPDECNSIARSWSARCPTPRLPARSKRRPAG